MKQHKCYYNNCNVKINNLITQECKCGNKYCVNHSFFKNHDCNYDFFKSHQEQLKEKLVKCNRSKIDII